MGIGIAFAGAGLKGVAHIGALKALEELGVKIDYVTGTSSGAMMATLYAMGFTPDEMAELTRKYYKQIIKIRKRIFLKAGLQFLTKKNISLQGIIDGETLEKFVEKYAKQNSRFNNNQEMYPIIKGNRARR